LKALLKRIAPRWFRRLYNRLISRALIRRKLGSWFDIDWNRTAKERSTSEWTAVYDRSWENWAGQDLGARDVERLRAEISECDSLLDAGCGDGFLLENLRDLADVVLGVDLSRKGLLLARKRLGPTPLLVQSLLESLPFTDNSIDTVISTHTLEHVKELDAAIAELIRVARKKLVILVPCQDEVLYSEDYHLHYFPRPEDLLKRVGLPQAVCKRHTVEPGECAYEGDVLVLTAEF